MPDRPTKIAIIGAGTIGLSFAALHLTKNPNCTISIYDSRPDLESYVKQHLPGYLIDVSPQSCLERLLFSDELDDAVKDAAIVQEQGPENPDFKTSIWPRIEQHAPQDALFWSSTSGIPASVQSKNMKDMTRLLVCHPYNPPHVMPLLEVVPSAETAQSAIDRTLEYWRALGRTPVVINKECTGFVANRLAFALLREACSLVSQGVVSVEDCDAIVQASMGPRWTIAGPFKAYHAGGGEGGLNSFLQKIGGTVQDCWEASDQDVKKGEIEVGKRWQDIVCKQTDEAYGIVNTKERDEMTRRVLEAAGRPW
ncbi:hydroxylacyl-CoA dehydrogenase [Teratosphaeria destructans]|uniref:L-gulonate 3-dehydrogenase n=1 Tax=Teratosphaeria destructans TaxID=418781 RepID=A0A9W7W0N7_9PEZI|nr:hydroxylacyl-CoA dehydrogenase [Teratosphaeria destructans]